MAVTLPCNKCGHKQSISNNPVDGRVMWWTRCEACKEGDFMSLPDPGLIDILAQSRHLRARGAFEATQAAS
jgi:hypothetical protein